MNDSEDPRHERREPASLAREVGPSLKQETRSWLRWGAWGAVLGAVTLGAAGFWFFGTTGLLLGAAIGAVAGGIGSLLLYLHGASVL